MTMTIVLFYPPPLLPTLFFFTDTPPPEIYTLSLHDALPICTISHIWFTIADSEPYHLKRIVLRIYWDQEMRSTMRSEEHTSELQSRGHLVCRLLLEKKKKKNREENK